MPPPTEDRERLLTVYRRWGETRTDLTKFKLENVELPQLYIIVALLLGILFSPIDDDFRASRNPLFGFTFDLPLTGGPLAVTVLLTSLVSALATHRLLSRKTFQERSFRPAVLAFRFLLGSLPIFSFLTFPVWQWIVKHRPSWSLRDHPPQPRLLLSPYSTALGERSWRAALSSWLDSKWVLVPVVVNHTITTIAISRWYTRLDSSNSASLWVLIGSSLTLHLIAFSCIISYIRYEIARGWMPRSRSFLLTLISFGWLLPIPYLPFLALLLQWALTPTTTQARTLIHQIFLRRSAAERLPLWVGLEKKLRKSWKHLPATKRWRRSPGRRDLTAKSGKAERNVLRIYDLKMLSLVPDAATMAWLLTMIASGSTVLTLLSNGLLAMILLGSLCGCLVGFLLSGWLLVLRLLSSPSRLASLIQHPYRYVFSISASLFLGLSQALAISHGKPAEVRGLSVMADTAFVMFQTLMIFTSFVLPPIEPATAEVSTVLRKLLLFPCFTAVPYVLALAARQQWGWLIAGLWLFVSLLLGVSLAFTRLPWLLRPYRWSQMFTAELPSKIRLAIGFLTLTAIVPCGGLAVPLWVVIRHRLWPRSSEPTD